MQLWMQKGDNYGGFAFYEISKNIGSDANVSLTYHDNASWQQATPSGSVNNVVPTSVPQNLADIRHIIQFLRNRDLFLIITSLQEVDHTLHQHIGLVFSQYYLMILGMVGN